MLLEEPQSFDSSRGGRQGAGTQMLFEVWLVANSYRVCFTLLYVPGGQSLLFNYTPSVSDRCISKFYLLLSRSLIS